MIWPFKRSAHVETKALTDEEILDLIGGGAPTASGVAVSVETALKVPAVSSAIRILAETCASLDMMVKAVDEDGLETDDPRNAVLPFLRDQANDWTSGFELVRDLMVDALTRDEGGLAHVNRLGDGRIAEIIKYPHGKIGVDHDAVTGEPRYRIDGIPVTSQNIIHLRSPFGRAPLSLAREAIGVAVVLERHAGRLFGRGARPSGALKFPQGMGEAAVKNTRTAWRATHEGNDAEGRTAILFDGADFVPFTFASTDAQFLENRGFQILEIARAFRVPPAVLYHLDRATWGNFEAQHRDLLVLSVEPWLKTLEGALRRAMFLPDERAGFAIRIDRDDLSRADLATRATAINSLRASKIINANEGRDWLGLEPIGSEGDRFENPNIEPTRPE